MDFTVIISQRGDPASFWYTTTAIDLQMQELKASYEYRVVSHGCDNSDYLKPYIERLGEGVSVHWQHFSEPLGSDTARQRPRRVHGINTT